MEEVKLKVNRLVADNRVQNARTAITNFLSDVKSWIVLNWKKPGWRGKLKVVCACVVAFFFCRGVFCGWGTSRLEKELVAQKERQVESDAAHAKALCEAKKELSVQKERQLESEEAHAKALREAKDDKELREAEAAARLFGALLGGGGGGSSSEKDLYMCRYCGNQVRSSGWPGGFKCSARGRNLHCDWKLIR